MLVFTGGFLVLTESYALTEAAADYTGNMLIQAGSRAFILYIAVFIAVTTFALPGYPLTILAGSFFGIYAGFAVSMTATAAAAAVQFLLARHTASGALRRRFGGNAKFRKIDAITSKHSLRILIAVRLLPQLPFALLNYGFGMTRIKFGRFLLWSAAGMIPWTLIYISGGDILGRRVVGKGGFPPAGALILITLTAGLFFALLAAGKIFRPEPAEQLLSGKGKK